MSKVSAMQAMREARYAAAARPAAPLPRAEPARRPAAVDFLEVEGSAVLDPSTPGPQGAPSTAAAALGPHDELPPVADDAPAAEEALCGHRSMNNRNCRRPAGHPEKNHRYG